MPYYFGEDDPAWERIMEQQEAGDLERTPKEHFAYVVPWDAKTTTLNFPQAPAPIPSTRPDRACTETPQSTPAPKQPGFFARIFGAKAVPPPPTPQPSSRKVEVGSPQWYAQYQASQTQEREQALLRLAHAAAAWRKQGVRRVLIRYDGGNDEGFTHFEAFEMRDGRRLTERTGETADLVTAATEAVHGRRVVSADFQKFGCAETFDDAVVPFLGTGFGTGPFEMFGAVTIDCDACTLTDEKDPTRCFPTSLDEA